MKIAAALNVTVDELLRERFGKGSFNQEKIKSIVIPIAEKHKLRSVYLFGSYARNEADENSDVDILIDREGSDIHGLLGMNDLLDEFRNALGKNVDLITLQSLYQESTRAGSADFVENVMKERIRIY